MSHHIIPKVLYNNFTTLFGFVFSVFINGKTRVTDKRKERSFLVYKEKRENMMVRESKIEIEQSR